MTIDRSLIEIPRAAEAHALPLRLEPAEDVDSELPHRVLNFCVAAGALVITAPLMAGIALAIRLTSGGPAFYTQTRIGWDRRRVRDRRGGSTSRTDGRRGSDVGGKPFTIYKFRTMREDAGKVEVWATADDPRVTSLGRFLRHYRLDELPQLINVLRGEMNLVGPRPEQPTIFASLQDQIRGYTARQRVRPGITGWAQINHPYDRSLDDVKKKLRFDLEYIDRRSVTHDLLIMLRTLPVMLFRRGAH